MNGSVRCLVVWGAATTAAGLLVAWLLPEPVGGVASGSGGFGPWLVSSSTLAAAGCVAWLWVLVTLVVIDALRGRPGRPSGRLGGRLGVPTALRRVVLAACGLSLAGGLVVPAHSDRSALRPETSRSTQALLVGLPLPDRTTTTTEWIGALSSRPAPVVVDPTPHRGLVEVEPGDTLWGIARATLPPGADGAEIDRRWRAIYRANLDEVGADPDLIHPGQRLLLPPTRSHQP